VLLLPFALAATDPRDALAAAMPPGVEYDVLAEVRAGDVVGLVTWPAFRGGKLLDDDIVGFVFRRGADGSWVHVPPTLGLSHGQKDAFLAMIGPGPVITRSCGGTPDEIEREIPAQMAAFTAAVAVADTKAALAAHLKVSGYFDEPLALWQDSVTEMAIKGAFRPGSLACDRDRCVWTVSPQERGEMALVPCGGGVVLGAPKKL
jgi:hypothetical protein